jgi:hypothetical protein
MATPGHDGLFGKSQLLGNAGQTDVGLLQIVEHDVLPNFIPDFLKRRTLGGKPPMQGSWMQVKFFGDPFVSTLLRSQELPDNSADLCAERWLMAGELGIDKGRGLPVGLRVGRNDRAGQVALGKNQPVLVLGE